MGGGAEGALDFMLLGIDGGAEQWFPAVGVQDKVGEERHGAMGSVPEFGFV